MSNSMQRPHQFVTRLQTWLQNPVTVKELRSRMRGRRAFVALTLYLLLLSLFLSLIYLSYAAAASGPYGPDTRAAGKVVFGVVVTVQVFLVLFIGPALTAGSISGEKERQTYDLLRTTLLPANALVAGKLLSALSYLFLLVLAAVPLQSIAFLLGGVALEELLISQLLIAVAAVTFALIGLFYSSWMRSTLGATVSTYATSLAMTAGVPILGIIMIILFEAIGYIPRGTSETIWLYTAILFAATNLPITIVLSEIVLLEEGALFFFSGGSGPLVPSPWWINVILYTLLSLVLYWRVVRRVRQTAHE